MSYIGRGLQSGAFRQLDDISSGFDGSDTTHTMQVNSTNVTVGDVNQILLSLGGVIQKPGTDFTVSSSVLTFTTAPAANTSFFAVLLGSDNGGTVTPTDGSVTTGKIVDDAVTAAKVASSGAFAIGAAGTASSLAGIPFFQGDTGSIYTHDVSGTDSPYRETANIRDGSMFTADMAVQNFVGDSFRGATWVSLHNGGGVGWGEVINGGFGLLIDGSESARKKIESMLHWDVNNGVARRAWARNPGAIEAIKMAMQEDELLTVTIPEISDDAILDDILG